MNCEGAIGSVGLPSVLTVAVTEYMAYNLHLHYFYAGDTLVCDSFLCKFQLVNTKRSINLP